MPPRAERRARGVPTQTPQGRAGKRPTIDPEFQNLITPLSGAERRQLEENILAHGCRTPLDTWRGILVDGHHRLAICEEHGIPYETAEIDLPDRDAVKLWMVSNQFGRRDLTTAQRVDLVRRVRPIIEAQARERMLAGVADPVQDSAQGEKTRDVLAKMAGVSHDTFTKAEYVLEHGDENEVARLLAGETSVNGAYAGIREREKAARFDKYKLYPDLDPEPYELLYAVIDRFGVLVPVVKDQYGNILDGHQRARIADELGIKYPVNIIEVADEAEALEIVRTLNEDRWSPPDETPGERFERCNAAIHAALEQQAEGVDRLIALGPEKIASLGKLADTYDLLELNLMASDAPTRAKAANLRTELARLAGGDPRSDEDRAKMAALRRRERAIWTGGAP